MANLKNILVVVESIDVEDSSGSKANVALIENLKKAEYHILVYHYTKKDIQLDGIPCISIKENRRSFLFILSRIERQLRYKFGFSPNKLIEKTFGFSFTLFNDRNSIVSSLKKEESFFPDLVLTLSKGGSFRPHHALLKLPEFHKIWMAYIHDPYPMHLYPRPYNWVEPGYEKKYSFVKEVTEKAGYLGFPSKLLMEWMGSYFQASLKKGYIIPHQINKNFNLTLNFPEFYQKENFNILHAGNLLWGRDPQGLIKGFLIFLQKFPEALLIAKLIFVGGKNHYSKYLESKREMIPQIYVSENYLPHDIVLSMQSFSAVNIILEAKSEISPFLPGKFPHCVQADKPILLLGPYYSESRRLLGTDYRYWAEIDDEELISDLIGEIYSNWRVKISPNLQRPDLEEYLSEKYLKTIFEQII